MKKTVTSKTTTPALKAKKLPNIKLAIKKINAEDEDEEAEEGEGSGKIVAILKLFLLGYSKKMIIKEGGFNKSTVYNQVGAFEKLRKAPATSYYGYELYEARVQRLMKAKKLTRDAAIKSIAEKDILN